MISQEYDHSTFQGSVCGESWDSLSVVASVFTLHGLTQELSSELIKEYQISSGKICAIGAGTGKSIAPFKPIASELTAVDFSPRMVRSCLDNGLSAVCGSACALPLPSNSYDLTILVTGVLDCMEDAEALKSLNEAFRISRKSGNLLICHFNYEDDLEFLYTHKIALGDKILTKNKIKIWREYLATPEEFSNTPRIRRLAQFFNALENIATCNGIALEDILSALPKWHKIRSKEKLIELAMRCGWAQTNQCHVIRSGVFCTYLIKPP